MKSYVINLANRPERLEHVRREFSQKGIPFERFDAVDKDQARTHPIARALPRLRSGRSWQPFEIGCLLSHFELWRRIAGGSEEFGAIFEDDIVIGHGLRSILEGDFPRDADIVKLETYRQVVYVGRSEVRSASGAVAFRRLKSVHEGTAGYLISRRAAKALVEAAGTFDEPVDRAMFAPRLASRRSLRVYQTIPAVVIQGMFLPEMSQFDYTKTDRVPVSAGSKMLLPRLAGRLFNHLHGIRMTVPFSG